MNEVGSLNRVFSRIEAIENRFGQTPNAASLALQTQRKGDFSSILSAVQPQHTSGPTASNSSSTSSSDIIKMIQLAAKKNGVDPKLAQAIARAESDYSPSAVSSAGAVGVMQLMPETAASLGVRDIQDPRQNIDGGVQYLKQMLTTFNGDVSMAVAAYNAGPQAVKNYNGVPPYSETQAYVQKVLSYYRNS
ncbi:soluble lytic murein transglycosylase-like protein [Sporomusaceae bacterium BoRhaA]|uniref:lytic transglycosylase domain-containing protein n=1 Tax=Pelorhabdus rhamnosifermentans TaxID=2772457 RepID=UPI0028A83246|nr:lytic transglycosylase domain-containing protein [Pelorhabdus rhamnosifermentans]MBU2702011.1 soluble lytic murein transglycosylase-like protein [Pelorhabdus rhamnosifermentans]